MDKTTFEDMDKTPNLCGLPEGIVAVRYGAPFNGEYVLQGNSHIRKHGGIYGGFGDAGLIVEPADGFIFGYDAVKDSYAPFPVYAKPRTLIATFIVTDGHVEKRLQEVVAAAARSASASATVLTVSP